MRIIGALRNGSAPVVALTLFLLSLCVLLSGFLPMVAVPGLPLGGVLETGQMEWARWAVGAGAALPVFVFVSRFWPRALRAWWSLILVAALGCALGWLIWRASDGATGERAKAGLPLSVRRPAAHPVGLVTALPLLWNETGGVAGQIGTRGAHGAFVAASRHAYRPLDYLNAPSLNGVERLLLAQPRLLQPAEMVALDRWVRDGGRGVFLVDPLLLWPSPLPPGDPRRPPLTSLLDPLLAHWGLRLEAVAPGRIGVERRRLGGGVVVLAGASRFVSVPVVGGDAPPRCVLADGGLIARCRVGRGRVALIADADLIDAPLWLAEGYDPHERKAWASDVVPLIDAWLDDPLQGRAAAPLPRRIADDAALLAGVRGALLILLVWAGLGWVGQRAFFGREERGNGAGKGNVKRT